MLKRKSFPKSAKKYMRQAIVKKSVSKKLSAKKQKTVNNDKNRLLVQSSTQSIASQNEVFKTKKIKVRIVGLGGGGCAIVSEIYPFVRSAGFVAADTDIRTAKKIKRGVKFFQFGCNITHGMGTGMDTALAQRAALEDKEKIKQLFENQDICVLVGCLGGGVASGAGPVFTQAAKEARCISIGFFTLPFEFEGDKKVRLAKKAIEELAEHLSGIMVVPNERIFQISEKKLSLPQAFSALNQIFALSLKELLDVVFMPGLINIDFADLRAILKDRGNMLFFSQAQTMGPNRAEEAVKKIFQNSLSVQPLKNVKRILFNISASKDLKLKEVEFISEEIGRLNPKAKIIFAVSFKNSLAGKIKLIVMAVCSPERSKTVSKSTKADFRHLPERQKKSGKKKILPAQKPQKESKKAVQRSSVQKIEEKKKNAKEEYFLPEHQIRPVRRTALEVQKAEEEAKKNELAGNTNWDIPAFLREKIKE